jgi:hypothetical protein
MDWFSVDKKGLAKLLERKGKSFAVFELIQNSWDTFATMVTVELDPIAGRPLARLTVKDDDPNGFSSLKSAWILFAESDKKSNAEKRGRFNLGEKLVLALCEKAEIQSTTGTVCFGPSGRTSFPRRRTERGSIFDGTMKMTHAEADEVAAAVKELIPPDGVTTTFNGQVIDQRPAIREFHVALPTDIGDEEGILRRSTRTARVTVHTIREGEVAKLYEMGIPVVDTGDAWHVNVHQKVPLSLERDGVSPAYLRAVRVAVLNAMAPDLRGDQANAAWVRDAAADPRASNEAIVHVLDERYGEKRVIADPTDPEGTKLAVSKGYAVIHGGSLSAGEWENVRRSRAALPAGQVTPSPKPYGDGPPFNREENPTPGMIAMATYAHDLGRRLLGADVTVTLANDRRVNASATYGPQAEGKSGHLVLNVAYLGRSWFDCNRRHVAVNKLLLHEFAHHFSSDHLSEAFHEAICLLGARLIEIAIDDLSFFAEQP